MPERLPERLPEKKRRPPSNPRPRGTRWGLLFLRNIALWGLPVWAVWSLLTPGYNLFLLKSAENLVQLTEIPNATALYRHPESRDDAYIARLDFPPAKRLVKAFRVTDVHFHLVLLAALFLAVPGIPWRERLENLGWSVLITIFFDIFVLFFIVKATYATDLGPWSLAHYGPFARNAYGLSRHLLDLPFKLGLPLGLWAVFYLRLLLDAGAPPAAEPAKPRPGAGRPKHDGRR